MTTPPPLISQRAITWSHYLRTIGVTALCTALAYPLYPSLDQVNIVMLYLLGTTAIGLRLGRGPSVLSAFANVTAFDFFFVPPRFTFYIADPQYLFTFGVVLVVALVIANLMVSVRKQAEAATLAVQTRAAAERVALRYTLLASISHDLRGPLSAIAGAGGLIAQLGENLDPLRRATLGYLIEEKALDMSGLLSNVLELIRLESTQMPIQRDWQSLEELVGAALRQMQHRLVNQRIVTLLPEDAPLLFLDGRLMLQLLSNLLGNAAQYTPPGTAIYVTAAISGQELRLTIEDDGPGFGNRDPEVLFEKFERGREESNVSGFGLGLAICRTVAQLHSGTIRATNRDPRGARFEVSLPLMTPSTSNSND